MAWSAVIWIGAISCTLRTDETVLNGPRFTLDVFSGNFIDDSKIGNICGCSQFLFSRV